MGLVNRKPRIGIVIDLNVLDVGRETRLDVLGALRDRFNELGQVRQALVISPRQLKRDELEEVQRAGFSLKVVPKAHSELSFLLETYDLALNGQINVIVIGSADEQLTPLFLACRNILNETIGFFLGKVGEKVLRSFNAVVTPETLETFTLFEASEPEYEAVRNFVVQSIQTENGKETQEMEPENVEADLFGPISENLED